MEDCRRGGDSTQPRGDQVLNDEHAVFLDQCKAIEAAIKERGAAAYFQELQARCLLAIHGTADELLWATNGLDHSVVDVHATDAIERQRVCGAAHEYPRQATNQETDESLHQRVKLASDKRGTQHSHLVGVPTAADNELNGSQRDVERAVAELMVTCKFLSTRSQNALMELQSVEGDPEISLEARFLLVTEEVEKSLTEYNKRLAEADKRLTEANKILAEENKALEEAKKSLADDITGLINSITSLVEDDVTH